MPEGGKEQRGTVLVVGGSREVPGGALLAGMAALRAGAGRVQVATARSVAPLLAVAFPEARVLGLSETRQGELSTSKSPELRRLAQGCQALVLGPGMGEEGGAAALLRDAQKRRPDLPLVVDAAALRLLGDTKRSTRRGTLIATPHAGEMAEMWSCSRSEAEADPTALAERAARTLGIVLVLKGACTIVAAPDGRTFRNEAGNAGLATSGSGDVLAGIVGGLAARGADAVQAAVWGVYLHAKAGDALANRYGGAGYLARELGAELPALLGDFSVPGRN